MKEVISMKKIRIKVEGRVQGVGFRFMTKMVADQLRIGGIVRNENDGSVYIEANGSEEQINEFIRLVKASPSPSGRVTSAVVTYDNTIEDRQQFFITGY